MSSPAEQRLAANKDAIRAELTRMEVGLTPSIETVVDNMLARLTDLKISNMPEGSYVDDKQLRQVDTARLACQRDIILLGGDGTNKAAIIQKINKVSTAIISLIGHKHGSTIEFSPTDKIVVAA
mgnify:CR=1 FL=1